MRVDGQRGSMSTELAVVAPLVVLLIGAGLIFDRAVTARMDVNAVVDAAARAASLERSPAAAHAAAVQTAEANLGDGRVSCNPLTVEVDTGQFTPGGQVVVTLTCTVTFSDLAFGFTVPGATTMVGQASSPVDTYRSVAP